jgi:hypothetical protein
MVNLIKAQLEQATEPIIIQSRKILLTEDAAALISACAMGSMQNLKQDGWAENQHTWGTETLRNKFKNSEIRPA